MRGQRVGTYRQRLTLYDTPEQITDSWGQPSQAATPIGTFWFEVRPLQGNEQLNVRQIWATATHIIKCRYLWSAIPSSPTNPNGYIMPTMKLISALDGTVYNINFAENVEERRRMWTLTCTEHIGATS